LRHKLGTELANWTIRGVARGVQGKRSKTAIALRTMMSVARSLA
jgi:hypothetical protein